MRSKDKPHKILIGKPSGHKLYVRRIWIVEHTDSCTSNYFDESPWNGEEYLFHDTEEAATREAHRQIKRIEWEDK
ncbi:MAG TPA: hypothetical protein ENH82_19110 [bacterium]|nr:hypothetical protein [bacterium]